MWRLNRSAHLYSSNRDYASAASAWPVCGQCYESWAINHTVYSTGAQLPSSSHPESHWEEPVLLSAWDCHKHIRRRKKQTSLWTLMTFPWCKLTMYRYGEIFNEYSINVKKKVVQISRINCTCIPKQSVFWQSKRLVWLVWMFKIPV